MSERSWWQRVVTAGVTATAEALYPKNDLGAPDWQGVQMVPRTLAWIDELPGRQRFQIQLLFGAIELAAPLLALSLRRFSRMAPEKRLAAVRRWRASRLLPLKIIADALKATTSMMYLSHPDSLRYIQAYKAVDRPEDPLRIEIRPDALEQA